MTFIKNTLGVIALFSILFVSACKEDPELPDNLVEFESTELGFADDESELTISINLFREAEKDAEIILQFDATGLTYGTDFTTEPAATGNTLALPVAKGATAVSFQVKKVAGILLDGDEQLSITISSVPTTLVLGENLTLALSFEEIVAGSGSLTVNGGGALYPNKVFIDLSANRQTAVTRTAWDLGFSSGENFRVILNSSTGAMARMLDKNDLNAVTAADTAGFGKQLSIAAVFAAINQMPNPGWVSTAITWIDDPTGDITKTALAEISATATENKVYILNRGTGPGVPAPERGWKKIRVLRNGNGFTVQHADINSTSFSEIQINKNANYAFNYVNLNTGPLEVEPVTTKWDIAWTGFTNSTNFGSGPVPYYFQDIILQNMTGVQTVEISTATKAYETFAEADLAGLDFGTQIQTKIGSRWRNGGGPSTPASINTTRFFIIKDGAGNYYKLRFTALTTNDERGKPRLEYALLKKG